MNNEIIKLANEITTNYSVVHHVFDRQQLETFYRAAFNLGLTAGANDVIHSLGLSKFVEVKAIRERG